MSNDRAVQRAVDYLKGEGYQVIPHRQRRLFRTERETVWYVTEGGRHWTMSRAELLEFAGITDDSGSGDFSIGGDLWPGLSKLIEENGEVGDLLPEFILMKTLGRVQQVAGKIIGNEGRADHWDGSDLPARLADELDDLEAAIMFMREHNPALNRISDRPVRKKALFNQWHTETQQRKADAA